MFIYADESGNTGRNIFDAQDTYRQGAILAMADANKTVAPVVSSWLTRLSIDRLHANQLTVSDVEAISLDLIRALNSGGIWQFHLTVIHKPYLAPTKFVDTVFDSGENLGTRWLWYNHEYFRHVLCLFFDELMDLPLKRRFWDAFLNSNAQELSDLIEQLNQEVVSLDMDERLREVIIDSFAFALRHPEEITLISARTRAGYKPETPNMIAFVSLMQAIHEFAELNDVRPVSFVHDRSTEFGTTMREYQTLFGRHMMVEQEGFMPRATPAIRELGEFAAQNSQDSPALQAVDVLLYLLGKTELGASNDVRGLLLDRTDEYYISPATSLGIIMIWQQKLFAQDLDEATAEKARGFLYEMEGRHVQRLKDFEGQADGS